MADATLEIALSIDRENAPIGETFTATGRDFFAVRVNPATTQVLKTQQGDTPRTRHCPPAVR
jgi:hypothetical protein